MLKKIQIVLAFTLISSISTANEKIKLKGDFRFRTENIREEQISPLETSNRTRQRIRARIKMDVKVNETTDVFVRFATGASTAAESTSTNQDLTDYSAKKGIYLDLAYGSIKLNEQSTIEMGKMSSPFFSAASQDLVFDSDLTPEGMAFKYNSKNQDSSFFFEAATFWLNERFSATGATDNTDVGLISAQAGYAVNLENKILTLALAQHNFSNIKNSAAASAKGNTTQAGNYTYDYKLLVADLELQFATGNTPCSVFYQYANNSDPSAQNNAGLVGIKYGQTNAAGDWSISLDHREVEKDAVVGILSESDSSGGGADIRSNRLTLNYVLQENTNLNFTAMLGQKTISSTTFSPNYQRLQLDLNHRF